ncbi:M48 family metallopeptidase [Oerskovia paurometabola]|uniref:M48 family metalloprotease n=1 Tax=Oerskovia paurometabola TaxID=162170 RepID=A0ABW1X4X1_9CELL|nr:M48 family metallopeptidase [Oerskovia paurometabola]MBM7498395.1 Zn-dependent protease with chaperone function [Oerskovia paurometabola]
MSTTLRAALSVLMLVGFYVVALAMVVGLGAATVWAFSEHAGPGAAKLGFLTVVVAVGLVVALWKVARAKPSPEPGVVLSPSDAPELWSTVRELADVAQTRVPDEIRLVADVNAAVSEETRLLGLVGGKRHLYIGVPLLQAMSVAQMRSILGHELGHYSQQHTRLGAVTYRGRSAIMATVQELSGNLVGWFLKQYAKLYVLVSAAVSRRQELEADQISVRVAGRSTAQSALREVPLVDTAWTFYERQYIGLGWENGYAPTSADVFGGFARILEARDAELASMREETPDEQHSRWDTHPAIGLRIAAMEKMPEGSVTVDERPASVLVPGFEERSAQVAGRALNIGTRTAVDWQTLTERSMPQTEQRHADLVYRGAARVAGQSSADLTTVLELVRTGRLVPLVREFVPEVAEPDAVEAFTPSIETLLGTAAVHSGVGTWRLSWSGPAQLVGPDGEPLPLEEIGRLALDPATVDDAVSRLSALGIDTARAVQVSTTATAHGAEILGGLANVKVDGAQHDVLVLDTGLVLRPCPKKSDGGKNRLIALLQSGEVADVAASNRYLAFEDIREATVVRAGPVRADLTLHDGTVVRVQETWSGERLTKDSDQAFLAGIYPYVKDEVPAG